jgi:hypothetical protein
MKSVKSRHRALLFTQNQELIRAELQLVNLPAGPGAEFRLTPISTE